ncbi:granulocyte colony-stimulating factor-like [Lepisosteus oculatus]|uniref:granulocyte colony-stimulating factor-like n=1 Tax=Lepisosteus oculatus TaxID=7918 RepID=UPI00370FCA0C
MNSLYTLSMHFCLALLACAHPLPEYSGEIGLVMEDPEFQKVVSQSWSLVKKIQDDIPEVTKALALPDYKDIDLQMMAAQLGIPSAPVLKALTTEFTLETSLTRMTEGLQMFQHLLTIVRDHSVAPEKLDILLADIRDLMTQNYKVSQLAQLEINVVQYVDSGLAARLAGEFEKRVAAHIVLANLRAFAQDVHRSLRHMSAKSRRAART